MENWFLLALIPPFLWSLNNIVDQFISRDYFSDSPTAFLCMGGLVNFVIVPPLAFFQPQLLDIPLEMILFLIGTGAFYMVAVYPYILALQNDDASLAIPMFQLIPFFTLLIGWVLLGELLPPKQLLAGVVIVAGSVGISWNFQTKSINRRLLFLMLLASILFAALSVFVRFGALQVGWLGVLFWMMMGWAISGIAILVFNKKVRDSLVKTSKESKGLVFAMSLLQESMDIFATAAFSIAMAAAPAAAIVMLVNGIQPFIVIVMSGFLGIFFPRLFDRIGFDRVLAQKLLCSLVMFIGLYMLVKLS